jgi:hypothetical protein
MLNPVSVIFALALWGTAHAASFLANHVRVIKASLAGREDFAASLNVSFFKTGIGLSAIIGGKVIGVAGLQVVGFVVAVLAGCAIALGLAIARSKQPAEQVTRAYGTPVQKIRIRATLTGRAYCYGELDRDCAAGSCTSPQPRRGGRCMAARPPQPGFGSSRQDDRTCAARATSVKWTQGSQSSQRNNMGRPCDCRSPPLYVGIEKLHQ